MYLCDVRATLCRCICACVCTRLSRAPWLETPQVSCGNGRHSTSGESGTSSPCVSSFGKGGFREAKQKPEVLRGTDVEEEEEGGEDEGRRETDACLWEVCTLCINGPSLPLKVCPALQTIKGQRLSPRPPSLSLRLTLKYLSSQRQQHCVAMAKPNNWQFVNRTMCVCFRLTTAFPPSLPLPLLTPPRTGKLLVIGCGWIAGGRRGVLCVCSNDV